ERHAATEEIALVQVAEAEIGVSNGRLHAAAPVAGGTRVGAGGARTNLEQPEFVDTGDAAATRADLDEGGNRDGNRETTAGLEAVDPSGFDHWRDAGTPSIDQAGFRRGAAHVEGEDAIASGERAVERRGQCARRRTRLQQPDGPRGCVRGGGNTA